MSAVTISPEHFELRIARSIADVTLARPEKKNPLPLESHAGLVEIFRAAASGDTIKVFVLSGAGENFRSGGDEGLRWSFFNRLSPADALLEDAARLAHDLAAGPSFALGRTRKMLKMEWAMGLENTETVAQALCMKTEDFGRAYQAFAAWQKPDFQGN